MAVVNGLTTVANAKLICGITSSTYDATIELLVNRASARISAFLGRDLSRKTYTEKLSGDNRQMLILQGWPIASITSVKIDDVPLVLNTDYRLDDQDKRSGMVYKENGWFTRPLVSGLTLDVQAAARGIDIVYIAGYYLPADVTSPPNDPHYVAGADGSLPLEIQGIVDELVADAWGKIQRKAYGLDSYKEGGISFGFAHALASSVALGFSDEHASVLMAFKRPVVA
jgi:hypothetical protein